MKDRAYIDNEDQLEEETEIFLKKNLSFLLVGLLVMALIFAGIAAYYVRQSRKDALNLSRNSFGQGSRSESLILEKDDKTRRIELSIEEQTLSKKEQKALFKTFFKDLGQVMKGENPSLLEVNSRLVFPDSLDGYPFALQYECSDPDFILLDGSLEEQALKLDPGQEKRVSVTVTARWGSVEESRRYAIRIIPPAGKKTGLFDQVYRAVLQEEEKKRGQEILSLPAEYKGVRIRKADRDQSLWGFWILGLCLVAFIPLHRYFALKEEGEKLQKEAERDFSAIVHYLVIYIEAGLVFPSAVRRIREDYYRRRGPRRYAYEKIVQMADRLDSGISQREACLRWGEQFRSNSYRKLSQTLIQSFDKGSRETAEIMDRLEAEAFRIRVERAKKEGEEAATRLLFPMILLLCQVIILVMFPALIRFQSF